MLKVCKDTKQERDRGRGRERERSFELRMHSHALVVVADAASLAWRICYPSYGIVFLVIPT